VDGIPPNRVPTVSIGRLNRPTTAVARNKATIWPGTLRKMRGLTIITASDTMPAATVRPSMVAIAEA
jgi:hypothetical protein